MYPETLLEPGNDVARFARVLDELSHAGRVDTIRRLKPAQFAPLYEAAKGVRAIGLDALVPSDTPSLTTVVHEGKNSLPLFSHFQKHFAKPDSDENVLWGFNHQSMSVFTGPGSFVVHPAKTEEGALDFDYGEVPKGKPKEWPALHGPRGIGYLVFGGLTDIVRGISEHVCIGRGFRRGKPLDAYFVLCRT